VTVADTEPEEVFPSIVISYVPSGMPEMDRDPVPPDTLPSLVIVKGMPCSVPLTLSVVTGDTLMLKLLPLPGM